MKRKNNDPKKNKEFFYRFSLISGLVITFLMLLTFGTKLIGAIIDKGAGELKEIACACGDWYDDPTGFFLTYVIGYALCWWKPLFGSLVIIAGSLLVTVINIDNSGFLIFAGPAFLVGFLYLLSWHESRMISKENEITP